MEEREPLDEEFTENIEVDITWEDIRCTVKTPIGDKHILKGISGHAMHGDFLVIMGSSGAGKTTLLNILSKRLKKSQAINISGSISVNHQPIDIINFTLYTSYVTQEDLLIPTMTVFETLFFVARLKTNYENKTERVNRIIKDLKLEQCKNTLIGNEYIKGVSGGERKRTSIAVELITNPSILFLDEPTSGLDSYTALIICKLLQEKADQGKTIICTIHQPSSDIFDLFDKYMLMADGQIVYHGLAKESPKFFAAQGFVCPQLENPADYYMQILNIKNSKELTEDEANRIETLVAGYKKLYRPPEPLRTILSSKSLYKSSFYWQLFYLTQRELMRIVRDPLMLYIRSVSLLSMIFLLVIVFRGDGDPDDEVGFSVVASLIFLYIVPAFYLTEFTTVLTFPMQLPIFEKEYQSNMYSVLPYCISINIIDFIQDTINTLILVSSTYWVIGFNTSNKAVLYFYAVNFLCFSFGSGIGNLLGSIIRDPGLALMLTGTTTDTLIYFTGYLRGKDMPSSFKWINYTSFLFYSFQALMETQFEDKTYKSCKCNDPNDCSNCNPLDIYNITVDLHLSLFIMIGMTVLLRLLSLLANFYRAKKLKPNN
jgi:ABC-type multidrug transport system ATPase subunit